MCVCVNVCMCETEYKFMEVYCTLRMRAMVAVLASSNCCAVMLPEVSSRMKMFMRPSAIRSTRSYVTGTAQRNRGTQESWSMYSASHIHTRAHTWTRTQTHKHPNAHCLHLFSSVLFSLFTFLFFLLELWRKDIHDSREGSSHGLGHKIGRASCRERV